MDTQEELDRSEWMETHDVRRCVECRAYEPKDDMTHDEETDEWCCEGCKNKTKGGENHA